MTTNPTPAGWYPDPENPSQSRYWDGTSWAAPSMPPPTSAPMYAGSTYATSKPQDYLIWSILNLVCLCLPLGIVALVFSIQTRSATDPTTAAANSAKAKTFNTIATALGVVLILVAVIARH